MRGALFTLVFDAGFLATAFRFGLLGDAAFLLTGLALATVSFDLLAAVFPAAFSAFLLSFAAFLLSFAAFFSAFLASFKAFLAAFLAALSAFFPAFFNAFFSFSPTFFAMITLHEFQGNEMRGFTALSLLIGQPVSVSAPSDDCRTP
ncbi:MAG: hypothetical protein IPP91_12430 [Betaproteobacteria bacterium]|nr:hypothetical protein [Betaproteobacteria bacterium]